ncbi:hypothetical protein EIK77_007018 [Talaromyces pinophilus]|nr:hypothetical protein EIK77_007018 [Talaromyces pinophilus]
MSWDRIIRFEGVDGKVALGEPIIKADEVFSVQELAEKGQLKAKYFEGADVFSLQATDKLVEVKSLLPYPSLTWEILSVQEGGRKPPPYPSIFIKPRASIASFNEDIPIPKLAQEDQLDYEGELCIVIGKTGKNIPKEETLSYIAGFLPANDVSARKWQRDPAFAGNVPQWCFSKGFDKFAPLGPMIVSPKIVGNAGALQLQTLVNGEVRQDTNTNDLLFNVETIVSFISQGTTLEKGTVIMTGTPAGVAMGMKEPRWLKDGDVVEVRIEGLGKVQNKMVFE